MSIRTIFRTTSKPILISLDNHREPDSQMSPIEPDDEGLFFSPSGRWQLVAAACNENTIYWFWTATVMT
jgi:hypothetical protein